MSRERKPLQDVTYTKNSSSRRKVPDEKCDKKVSPESKRIYVLEELRTENKSTKQNNNIYADNANTNAREKRVAFTGNFDIIQEMQEPIDQIADEVVISSLYEEYKETLFPKETIKERWKRLAKLAVESQRRNEPYHQDCDQRAKNVHDYRFVEQTVVDERTQKLRELKREGLDLEQCSSDQISTIIRYCYGGCPMDVTYREKLQSLKSLREQNFKKDSRKWLHKSSARAKRLRDERLYPEQKSYDYLAPNIAMSQENFRTLLAAHNTTTFYDDTTMPTTDLDTNSSYFDRINLGAFYDEHQRQKELILDSADSRENLRRSSEGKGILKRNQRHNNLTVRGSGSITDIRHAVSGRGQQVEAEPRKDKLYHEIAIQRSKSDSELDRVHLEESRKSCVAFTESKGKLISQNTDRLQSLELPSVPDSDVESVCYCDNCCMARSRNDHLTNSLNQECAEVQEYISWEEVDRNTMARYHAGADLHNTSPYLRCQDGRVIPVDQFSVPDSCSVTSKPDLAVKDAHSMSPNSEDDRFCHF